MSNLDNNIFVFKWEFLRRNPKYVEEYNKKAHSYIKSNFDDDDKGLIFPLNWGLIQPCDPKMDYSQNLSKLNLARPSLKNIFFPMPLVMFNIENFNDIISGTFNIKLDFTKKEILKSFEEQLDYYLKTYKSFNLNNGDKENRVRLFEYKRYIQVYDKYIVERDWDKLAKEFYKDDEINYAKKKVKRDYERCLKMIDGDFRQIG